jgi:hypothetical protein
MPISVCDLKENKNIIFHIENSKLSLLFIQRCFTCKLLAVTNKKINITTMQRFH